VVGPRPANRWMATGAARGAQYDRRFDELAARGIDMHGEAALVDSYDPASVLDAGCGTGRVAIELSRRGRHVVGIDQDPSMLEVARTKSPDVEWILADLADPELSAGELFDVVVMAGNVLIFVTPGTEGDVIAAGARHLAPGGRLISGYSLAPGGFDADSHDSLARDAGLELEDRWSTWDRQPFGPESAYVVSVHRKAG
jgi:SAM-dependent methyltransferase